MNELVLGDHECLDNHFACFNLGCSMAGARAIPLKDWDTRPIEDELRKRIAELEALIEHASKTQPATEIKKLENVNTTGDFAEITFKDGRTIGFYLGKVGDGEWRLWDVTRRFCVEGEK